MTERNLQVYPPVVLMHMDYLKLSREVLTNVPAAKFNETVVYLTDRNGPIPKSAVIRTSLTREIFDGVMERTSRNL